jgi:hypothetical protein
VSRKPDQVDVEPSDDADTSHAVPSPDPNSTPEQEIAIEQAFVDRVYERVDTLRADAESHRDAGYAHRAATVPGAQFERDVFVYRAARRIADLDSQHEGLVFGRLDFDDGKVRHVGRRGGGAPAPRPRPGGGGGGGRAAPPAPPHPAPPPPPPAPPAGAPASDRRVR